ncbi:hypothetical protein EVAR_73743_1, partial [Eumeta japonica]
VLSDLVNLNRRSMDAKSSAIPVLAATAVKRNTLTVRDELAWIR